MADLFARAMNMLSFGLPATTRSTIRKRVASFISAYAVVPLH